MRYYYQRVAQIKYLKKDIKHPKQRVLNYQMPTNILDANTGIEGIDKPDDGRNDDTIVKT